MSVIFIWASLVAQMVKNLPAMQKTRVQSLGQENTLEKGMATHSSILAHGQRSLVSYSPWGRKESDKTERLNTEQIELICRIATGRLIIWINQHYCFLNFYSVFMWREG